MAKEFRLPALSETLLDLEEMTTDLAPDLRTLFAIVEVEILVVCRHQQPPQS